MEMLSSGAEEWEQAKEKETEMKKKTLNKCVIIIWFNEIPADGH